MQTLAEQFKRDSAYWGGRGDWFVAAAITRDSGCLERSNFECIKSGLEELPAVKSWSGEFHPIAIERANHWAVGWVDYLVIDPACPEAVEQAEAYREKLEDYPILDEFHFLELEQEEATKVWRNCYNVRERLRYIREHRSQFEPQSLSDLIGCVRGNYFLGYASELITRMNTIPCPHCGGAIRPASMLAALSAGRPKHYTAAEIAIRTARLAEARKRRWPVRPTITVDTQAGIK